MALRGPEQVRTGLARFRLDSPSAQMPVPELPVDGTRRESATRGSLSRPWPRGIFLGEIGEPLEALPVFCAIWSALLHRYSGFSPIVTGYQDRWGVRPIRVLLDEATSFSEVLGQVKAEVEEGGNLSPGNEHERWLDAAKGPWFRVVVALEGGGASAQDTNGDLFCRLVWGEDGLALRLDFPCHLFGDATAQRVLGHLERLACAASESRNTPLGAMDYIGEGERRRLLVSFNDTVMDLDRSRTVVDVFEEGVCLSPDKIAVHFEDRILTYDALNGSANRLAHFLRDRHGIEPEDVVALMIEASERMPVILLGVLKAGAAYVPLDPQYPEERLCFMLKDSGAKLLIAEKADSDRFGEGIACLGLCGNPHFADEYPEENPEPRHAPHHLIYIIYTSGSTGRAKGVMIEHGHFWNLMADILFNSDSDLSLVPEDRLSQFASLSFDVSIAEIFMALLARAALFLLRHQHKFDALFFADFLERQRITVTTLPPAFLHILERDKVRVRMIITGGDSAYVDDVRYYSARCHYVNSYGPTETTVGASYYRVVAETDFSKPIPIGKPVANVKFYILDDRGALTPIGLPGEIVIAGACVGRGYRNLPELTAKQFLDSPFVPGERVYRTGDLGRWLPDGNLAFLGRRDDQVKVRGFRIECGEVELKLTAHAAVREAAVLARQDASGGKILVAFLTVAETLELEGIKPFLAEHLPRHAIPDLLVPLEALPLNPNGKVDRQSLAAMALPDSVSGYQAPSSPWEPEIAALWETVLKRDRIGRSDNLFDLGVDSLKASHFAALFFREHHIKIPLKEVFTRQTPAALALWVGGSAATPYETIPSAPELGSYPLSHAQKRLWVLDKVRDEQHAYNMCGVFLLEGPLDRAAFAGVFEHLLERHESMRTVFPVVDGEPVQVIHARLSCPIVVIDWSLEANHEQRIQSMVRQTMDMPFDLARPPLFRMLLVCLEPERSVFLFTMHHIISDGWSMSLLVRDMREIYNASMGGETPEETAPHIRYRDYAHHQMTRLAGDLEADRAYWLARLSRPIPVLALPADFSRPARKTYEGRRMVLPLSAEMIEGLRELGGRCGTSLFMTLLACVQALMRRYSGQSDLILGSIVAGRDHPELREIVGFFVNTLALRVSLDADRPFSRLLERVKNTVLEAYDHQDYPFDRLVDDLAMERNMSRAPLIDVMVVLQDLAFSVKTVSGMHGVSVRELPQAVRTSKFDLSFIFDETGEGLVLNLHYSTDLFSAARVRRMTGHLERLMAAVIARPGIAVADITLLTREEKAQILAGWAAETPVPATDETVLDLVARHAGSPDRTVLFCASEVWSRAHLERVSEGLARGLMSRHGIGPDDRVALVLERSPLMAAAILGVWKCGAAHVSVDPEYPANRIRTTLENSHCRLALTQDLGLIPKALSAANPSEIGCFDGDCRLSVPRPEWDAYILYTSGSTGRPKGVPITHRNLSHTLAVAREALGFDGETAMAVLSSPAFDIFQFELFVPLIAGGSAVLLERSELVDHERIRAWLPRVDSIHAVPAVMREIVRAAESSTDRPYSIRRLFTGGDTVPASLLRRMAACFPGVALNVLYGPTETAIIRAHHPLGPGPEFPDRAVGRELPGTGIYIMDRRFRLRPIGFPGEICIAGPGLGRGYLDGPCPTAQGFLPNPFENGERLYRTGDLGVRNEDGLIRFVGRADRQVKVRGYRIELGEIEAVARKQHCLTDAVAAVLTGEPAQLALYFLSADGKPEPALRAHLEENLPRHMRPTFLIRLERFPLTTHGKLDRKALPDPRRRPRKRIVVLPRNPVESELLAIWESVLGRDGLGIHDDFFLHGGDSIKAIQIASRLHRAGYRADMRHIFRTSTVATLAGTLEKRERAADQSALTGPVPLSPVQRRFFAGNPTDPGHHAQALLIRFEEPIEEEAVAVILGKIQEYHDMLRAVFPRGSEGVDQEILDPDRAVWLEVHEQDPERELASWIQERADALQAGLELETGPLMKAAFFKKDDGGLLLWVIHHLVIDAVSWRLLVEDFDDLLMRYTDPDLLDLPPKTHSFRDWSRWLAEYAQTGPVHADYWAGSAARETDPVPVDFPDAANLAGQEERVSFSLEPDQTRALLGEAHRAFGTRPDDLLLAGLAAGLNRVFGLELVRIELESHGRDLGAGDLDFSRTAGWFTSFYPVILRIEAGDDPAHLIIAVKDAIRRIPDRGLGYGLRNHGGQSAKPDEETASIAFNYLGQTDTDRSRETLTVVRAGLGRHRSPSARRPHELEMMAMVADGRLTVSLSYGGLRFETATMQRLADHCESALKHIVARCLSQPEPLVTSGDFSYKELSFETLTALAARYDMEDLYPLSPLQEGMLFHAHLDPESTAYFEQVSYRWQAPLAPHLVERSLDRLFEIHGILRTAFVEDGLDRPLQLVLKHRGADFCYLDASALAGAARQTFLIRYLAADRDRTFDLARDVLMRVTVLKLAERDYRLVWSHHHIIMDGWCLGILNTQFIQIYTSLLDGKDYSLPPVRPYKDYISWLGERNGEEALGFWRSYLSGYEGAAGVPRQKAAQDAQYQPATVRLDLGEDLSARLQATAAAAHLTESTVLRSAWGLLLARYNGRNDVVFGCIVAGRPSDLEGVESMIGLFINNVPVRIGIQGSVSFLDLCRKVQRDTVAAEPYHYLPLAEVQRITPLKHALIDHIFLFDNYPLGDELSVAGSGAKGVPAIADLEVFEQTNYDFNLSIEPAANGSFSIQIDYNRLVFDSDFTGRVAGHLRELLRRAVKDFHQTAGRIGFLPLAERYQLMVAFNDTAVSLPEHGSPVRLFEEMAQRYAAKEAVVFADRALTYGELNLSANRLAHFLIHRYGIGPEDRIALPVSRSQWLFVMVLAVWKAGAAYIPIDPEYPADRVRYLMKDSAARLVLTDLPHMDVTGRSALGRAPINIHAIRGQLTTYPEVNPRAAAKPQNLAYLIYTSGSTGQPKGVMIDRGSVVNLWHGVRTGYRLDFPPVLLQLASFSFDVFVEDLCRSLFLGGTLVLCSAEARFDPTSILDLIPKHGIQVLDTTPALLVPILDAIDDGRWDSSSLKTVVFGADRCALEDFRRIVRRLGDRFRIYNSYGTTETAVDSSCYCPENERVPGTDSPPIGRPLSNHVFHVLGPDLEPVPAGVPGELLVGGKGVARGYLNRPDLTASRFIPGENGSRRYRTGDRVRWMAAAGPDSGLLEFLGRIDAQLKIRGFRIEPGEIENQLLAHSAVGDSAIVAFSTNLGGSESGLAAFWTGRDVPADHLRDFLCERLPAHMVPAHFVFLDALPLSPNGKVDRKALSAMAVRVLAGRGVLVPARDKTEAALVSIWEEVLQREPIGIRDNFFEIGGHSLKATRVLRRIERDLGIVVPLRDLFSLNTVETLARSIANREPHRFKPIPSVVAQRDYATSHAQRRLWTLGRTRAGRQAYNLPGGFLIEGDLDRDAFARTLHALVVRHDSLRTVFVERDGELRQVIREPENSGFVMGYEDVRAIEPPPRIESLMRGESNRDFDFEKGPLFLAKVWRLAERSYLLLVNMHHIVTDGWSIDIILREIKPHYEAFRQKKALSLTPLALQYKDYAAWHNRLLADGSLESQRRFWRARFRGGVPSLDLPLDHDRLEQRAVAGRTLSFVLEPSQGEALNRIALDRDLTLFMVLTAVVKGLLYHYCGQTDIVLGTPVAGRIHADLEDQVGFFVNTLPIRTDFSGAVRFSDLLDRVRESTLAAFQHQAIPFDLIVDDLGTGWQANRNPIFDVLITLQNTGPDRDAFPELDGLTVNRCRAQENIAMFELDWGFTETPDGLAVDLAFAAELFEIRTIRAMCQDFRLLVLAIAGDPDWTLAKMSLMLGGDAERPRQPDQGPDPLPEMVARHRTLNENERKIAEIWREVLAKPDLGPLDNFFDLGGHSLKGVQITTLIRQRLGVVIGIGDLFANPSVAEFANVLAEASPFAARPIEKTPYRNNLEASHAQTRFWTLEQTSHSGAVYNMPGALRLDGLVNMCALETALWALIERHESLRTGFRMVDGSLRQEIAEPGSCPCSLQVLDFRECSEREKKVTRLAEEEAAFPFDLARPPLLRLRLVRTGARRHLLLFTPHHIIADGWSMAVLTDELITLYHSFAMGDESPLPPLTLQFRDFAVWQAGQLSGETRDRLQTFWRKQNAGALVGLALPSDFPRPPVPTNRGATLILPLGRGIRDGLRRLGRSTGSSPFMVLLAVFKVLLHRLSGQCDLIVGTPMAGRNHPGLENQIGLYLNTLPLRTRITGNQPFLGFLARVRVTVLAAHEHALYPLDLITRDLRDGHRDMSRSALFDVMFGFQTWQEDQDVTRRFIPGLKLEQAWLEHPYSPLDLSVEATEYPQKIVLKMTYSTELFSEIRMRSFYEYFKALCLSVCGDPHRRIGDLGYVPREEKERLMRWAGPGFADEPTGTVLDWFRARVRSDAESTALTDEEQSVKRGELDALANGLARILVRKGIKPGDRVAFLTPRTVLTPIGMLALFKIGAVYVPIDPDYPETRIVETVRDSGADLVLMDWGCPFALGAPVLVLDPGTIPETDELPSFELIPDWPAYLIYTSGSTGKPNGVLVSHHALAATLGDTVSRFGLGSETVMPVLASFAFDISLLEVWAPLSAGGSLRIVSSNTILNREGLRALLAGVTALHAVPALMSEIVRVVEESRPDSSLPGLLLTGGDSVQAGPRADLVRTFPAATCAVLYGPTEATIICSAHRLSPAPDPDQIIGRPAAGGSLYVLDRRLRLVAAGVLGEICIAGGLAMGYWNRPALTAERFLPNPFGDGERCYRTGDLGFMLPSGALVFAGRKDNQVKIRGYRIECGEIEKAMTLCQGVSRVLVTARTGEDGRTLLLGYYSGEEENPHRVRKTLKNHLPKFMVPAHIIRLDRFPLTANGKIDRRALPGPEPVARSEKPVRPLNPAERLLAEIWTLVLGREPSGPEDDFFAHGGDSISAIQLIAELTKSGQRLEMADLIRNPRLEDLALAIKRPDRVPEQGVITGSAPLTPVQARFFQTRRTDPHHFNHALMLRFEDPVDEDDLEEILSLLTEHHDVLRTRFIEKDGGWMQEIQGLARAFSLDVFAADSELGARAQALQTGIDLGRGPLLKAALFPSDDGDRLMIVVHHLAVDLVSWHILLDDFTTLFRQTENGEPLLLPPKTDSYLAWSTRLAEEATGDTLLRELPFWSELTELESGLPPADFEVAQAQNKDKAVLRETLDVCESVLLSGSAAAVRDLLLEALATAFFRAFGTENQFVELESHGRRPWFSDLDVSRTVGWFTALYPVLLSARCGGNGGHDLNRIPHQGLGHGILRYLTPDSLKSGWKPALEPRVRFDYLGDYRGPESGDLPFTILEHCPGESDSRNGEHHLWFEFSGVNNKGSLCLELTYNRARHRDETAQKLFHHFIDAVRQGAQSGTKTATARIEAPASFAQLELWHEVLARKTHIIHGAFRLTGVLDARALFRALQTLAQRHEPPRTTFAEKDGKLLQIIHPPELFGSCFSTIDCAARPDPEFLVSSLIRKNTEAGCDLERGPLFKVYLMRLGNDHHVLTVTLHHLIADGWSVTVLMKELLESYNAAVKEVPFQVDPLTRAYRHFAEHQHRLLSEGSFDEARRYWLDRFKAQDPKPNRGARPQDQSEQTATLDLEAAPFLALARANHVTLFVVLTATVKVLLHGLFRENHPVLGTAVANRSASWTRHLGFFANTLPLFTPFAPRDSFNDLILKVRETLSEAVRHQAYPFSCLLGELNRAPGSGRPPLVDAVITLQDAQPSGLPAMAGLAMVRFGEPSPDRGPLSDLATPGQPVFCKHGLNFTFSKNGSILRLYLSGTSDHFKGGGIARFLARYRALSVALLRDPERQLANMGAPFQERENRGGKM